MSKISKQMMSAWLAALALFVVCAPGCSTIQGYMKDGVDGFCSASTAQQLVLGQEINAAIAPHHIDMQCAAIP